MLSSARGLRQLYRAVQRPYLVAFSVAFAALVSAIATSAIYAQPTEEQKAATDAWVTAGGTVEIEGSTTLTIREGEFRSYRFRLTRQPLEDGWFVRVIVAGSNRSDGEYDADGDGENDISWVPSVGWNVDITDSNNEATPTPWRGITIHALEDDDKEDQTITFSHELWDHNTYCPPALHGGGTPLAMLTVHIIDDDSDLPSLSIEDTTVDEGDEAEFVVKLSKVSDETVTVDYRSVGGTAVEGTDYTAKTDTLTFAAGDTEKTIGIQTTQDELDEPNEEFSLTLSNPDRAALSRGTGTGTITDDDNPTLSIADAATVDEGGTAQFVVTMSIESTRSVTVNYQTSNGTAVAGQDFQTTSETLTFGGINSSLTQTIFVPTIDDLIDEEDGEEFTVTLSSPSGGTIKSGEGTATGTINDNDDAALSIADLVTVGGGNDRAVRRDARPDKRPDRDSGLPDDGRNGHRRRGLHRGERHSHILARRINRDHRRVDHT